MVKSLLHGVSVQKSCSVMKYNRSSYYKRSNHNKLNEFRANNIVNQVQCIRRDLPRIGIRKLHYILHQKGYDCGRDWLFNLMRENGLLVQKHKRYCYTTNSNHRFKVYKNHYKEFKITESNQVWVSDITYLKTRNGFCYASLITDAHSRMIVGYDVHQTLERTGVMSALNKALRTYGTPIMHHSDRGTQYCSKQYTQKLKDKGIIISMTEDGNCYDNALAERINGILKDEFLLFQQFKDLDHARKALCKAVRIYNNKRPHLKLNFKTPTEIHNIENNCLLFQD